MPGAENPLDLLRAFDRLEVGPTKLKKRRLTCPYTVVANERTDTFDFQCSYEEDVGNPTKAGREKGEQMWALMIRNLVEFVEQIKGMTLSEIHQRRRC